jgi:hypothetical protein
VTLMLVTLAVPTRNWSLRILMVVTRMFTLIRLSYLQSFYGLHPPRKGCSFDWTCCSFPFS